MNGNIQTNYQKAINPDGTYIGTPAVVTVTTGNLTTSGSTVTFDMENYRMGYFSVTGTFNLTFTLEASFDSGSTWSSWPYHGVNLYTTIWQTSNTGSTVRANEFWGAGPFQMRVRASAYTSGTAVVTVYGCPQATFPSLLNSLMYGQGYTAHDSSIAGTNPILISGYGSRAAPSAVAADGRNTQLWADRSGRLVSTQADEKNRITTATTTVVKNAVGKLQKITFPKTTIGTVTVYNNTSAAGEVVMVFPIGTTAQTFHFGCLMSVGITVVTSAADELLVTYSD